MPTPDPNDPLDRLAESVSDGMRVDWDRIQSESRLDSDTTGALKDLERIAEFSRALQRTRSVGQDEAMSSTRTGERWGDLLLLELIGAGAKGEVWRAWDSALQREVALKFLQASKTAPGSDPQAELLNEARALARVRHRGVVAIYGIAERDGRAGMWMECLQGPTLAREIERVGALPAARVADIGLQLCSALEALESKGLVHRDIKPANIVLEGDRVVLTDFGLGWRPAVVGAETLGISGTPMFMAPEILAGEGASARSDLYALGVTLWWALAGKAPFRATTLGELREETARGPGERLTAIRPDAPQGLIKAIEWAMRPAAAERPASAAALLVALRSAFDEIGARSQTIARRNLAAWAIGGVALTAIVAVLLLALRAHPPFSADNRGTPVSAWQVRRLPIPGEALDRTGGECAISPDGSKMAYLPDSSSISVVSLASGDSRVIDHLEPDEGSYLTVGWVSDGSKLVSTRCDRAGDATALLVDAVTGQREVLARLGRLGLLQANDLKISLSPNGALLAVRRDYRPSSGDFTELDVLNVHTGEERRLARVAPDQLLPPAWSPSSDRIAYVVEKGNDEYTRIETCDLRGMRTTVLEDSEGGFRPYSYAYRSLRWLADGRVIYAVRTNPGAPGTAELWTVPVDSRTGRRSGLPKLLYSIPGGNLNSPSASADGRRIAFHSDQSDDELRFIRAGTRPEIRIEPAPGHLMGLRFPVWAADELGLFVRYDRDQQGGAIGRVRLKDGRFERLLPASLFEDQPLCLSNDGTELFCRIGSRLVAVPVSGGAPRLIADSFTGIILCSRESGRCLAVQHDANEIVVRDFDPRSGLGAVRFRYSDHGLEGRFLPTAALSPDGSRIALLRPDEVDYVILDATNGRRQASISLPKQAIPQSVQWAPDGTTLYASGLNRPAPFWIAHLGAQGIDRLLWHDDAVWPGQLALSPDGSTLAFRTLANHHEMWVIERP